jgi:hypothetical protein
MSIPASLDRSEKTSQSSSPKGKEWVSGRERIYVYIEKKTVKQKANEGKV